ncbi:glycosyltransferase family 39 protein [bacterium]|nr:glycosyltransferase family 39 protein [bacterium]
MDVSRKNQPAHPVAKQSKDLPDDRGILACLILLQVAVFFTMFAFKGFGLDEILSLNFTDGSIGDLFADLSLDSHPPGYFLLLWAWRRVFAVNEYSVHLLSLLLSLPTIPLLYVLVRKVMDRKAALWSCLLLAVSAYQGEFAAQARMYGALETLTVLSTLLLVVAEERPGSKRAAAGYAVSMAACIYIHYFGFFVLASHALYLLVRGEIRRWRRWLAVYAGVSVAILPCLVMLPGQLAAGTYNWVNQTQAAGARFHYILEMLNYNVFGDWHELIGPIPTLTMMYIVIPCLAVGVVATLRRRAGDGWFPQAGILPIMLIAPIYLVLTVSQAKSIFMPRYLIETLPFLVTMFGVAIATIPLRAVRRGCGFALAIYFFALTAVASASVPRIDWKNAVGTIQKTVSPEHLGDFSVFCHDRLDYLCVQYYVLHGRQEYAQVRLVVVPRGDYRRVKAGDLPRNLCTVTRQPFDGTGLPPNYALVQVHPLRGCWVSFFSRSR